MEQSLIEIVTNILDREILNNLSESDRIKFLEDNKDFSLDNKFELNYNGYIINVFTSEEVLHAQLNEIGEDVREAIYTIFNLYPLASKVLRNATIEDYKKIIEDQFILGMLLIEQFKYKNVELFIYQLEEWI